MTTFMYEREGRPTRAETRAKLLQELRNGGVAYVEADPDGQNKKYLLNSTTLDVLREIDAEGLVEVVKVPLALSDRVVLRAIYRDREAEAAKYAYDRLSDPQDPNRPVGLFAFPIDHVRS